MTLCAPRAGEHLELIVCDTIFEHVFFCNFTVAHALCTATGGLLQVVLSLMVNRYEFSLVNADASMPNPWIIPTISLHGTHLTVKKR